MTRAAAGEQPRPFVPIRLGWTRRAACRGMDTDLWFPFRETPGTTAAARRVCARCPVKQPCLDYALENGERFGVWGGLDTEERRRLLRARRPA